MANIKSYIRHRVQDVRAVVREMPMWFFLFWLSVSVVLFGALFWMGLVPPALFGSETESAPQILTGDENISFGPTLARASSVEPVRLIIEAVNIDTEIVNPKSRDIQVLDEALQSGAVHYPGSGNLNDTSNMFIFGHSSYLPNVMNEAYKAFNGLQDLAPGDVIKVQSAGEEHVYVVETVSLVDANEAWVELSNDEKKLTLSTCNTFGQKQDRFVVEARFVGSYGVSENS